MGEWKEYRLGELIKLKYGKDHKPLQDGTIPAYGSGGIMRFVNQAIYRGPSILIPRKGSLNNVIYINTPFWTVDTMFWSIINEEIVDSRFLYYAICKYNFEDLNVGSAIPSLTVPVIEAVRVKLPTKEIQTRIADIIDSVNEKIETNRNINARLEELAHALFKSWFIDFEPFGGKMPEDWETKSLSSIANYLNGLAMQKYPPINTDDKLPVLKIKELGDGYINVNSDFCSKTNIGSDYVIENGDIIFSWSGTLLVKVWTGGKCGLNQHLFKVTSNHYPKWFYYFWTLHHNEKFKRIAKDKAVTMGHIKREELDKAKVNVPSLELIIRVDKFISPILDQIQTINLESSRLAALRDTLLPKLMSGELLPE